MNHHDDHRIDIEPELAPPDRLDAYHRRQLSAMLDGELSPDQARFMLRRLQHDTDLAARWERWQVCGDVLRGRGHALLPADFSQRVAAAVATPGSVSQGAGSSGQRTRQQAPRTQGLLRWGGGALAASVALVALFMARPLPESDTPGASSGASGPVAAMALVEPAPMPATEGAPVPGPAGAADLAPGIGGSAPSAADAAAALLAGAAPAALAVSEVPRRASERGGTRSQAQRSALRRSQAVAAAPPQVAAGRGDRMHATAMTPQDVPALPATEVGALFGNAPAPGVVVRPWPRAVLPGLSGRQPYAAGYGLPQPDAFAPFQPRFEAPLDRVLQGSGTGAPAGAGAAAAGAATPSATPPPGAGVSATDPALRGTRPVPSE